MRLLVAYDGSDGGRDALELARVLGSVAESSALVVAVMPYAPLPVAFAELERDAAEQAEPLLSEARERLDGLEVETRAFGGGSPAGVITDLAEAEGADTIVLGSPHRGAVGRALIGSVAEGVLHGAPCAAVVAPRGYAHNGHGPFATIAVAYDGTPEAKAALARARRLAEQSRAALRILTVLAPPVALPGAAGYTPVNPPQPDEVIAEGVAGGGDAVPVDGRRLDGAPAQALAEACEDDVDLLVAGSRGYGPMTRLLLGSVSSRLVALAPCPVLVVPRPGRD
ncbi:MAG TPA: universal stress protein [Solirubrobacterales bacterium]|nr:universal stress protein [Solirubrobacterales bacterium]